ncbi:extracellular solute-binding protein [Paenibacillus sp. JSM ZJ436]|nr:extracellular solute-binding protein [Paenibacillus algicola]
MRKPKTFMMAVTLVVSVFLSGCSESKPKDESGSKDASADGISFQFARMGYNDVRPASKDLWMWKKYEEMTGVHIDWEEIPGASLGERKNIIMASNDLPDAFYQIGFSHGEISKYGKQGLFLPLDELIEEHAPNLSNLFKTDPSIKQALTMPDGRIYSLPYVDESIPYSSLRLYINEKWLDQLGLSVPKTTEELYTTLKAFKEQDANGNGDPNDEHGWYMPAGSVGWTLERQLYGSFGMGNGGLKASENWIYKDSDGQLKLIFNDEKFRDVWKYLNRLYAEELLHPETFTGVEYAQWVADGAKDLVGGFSWVVPDYIGDKVRDHYSGINALEGPGGDKVMNWLDHPVRGMSSFIITNVNKHPEETIKWVDYFYGEEGSTFGTLGLEGETYTMVDGKPQYIDEIRNYEGGMQLGAFQYVDNVYGGFYPYLEPPVELRTAVKGTTVDQEINADLAELEKFKPEEIWPNFAPTDAETSEIDPIMTDINSYIEEMRVKFITGTLSLDADWDNYVKTLDQMGAQRYLEIKRAQYERYQATN